MPERAHLELRWPNVLRVETVVRPALAIDWSKVQPLVLDPASTPISAELAPALGGATDMGKVTAIDLEKLPDGFRLQRLVFQAARKAFAELSHGFTGTNEYLAAQLVRIVEAFLNSDRLEIPSLFHSDPLRRRILIALNIDLVVQHVLRNVTEQNTERLTPVFDEENPIGATGQTRTWYTTKPCFPTTKSHISHLVTGMRLIYATIATTLMVLAFTGGLTPGVVLMLVAVMGLVRPSDPGLRQALIADTIPLDRWPGAIGMSRITSDLARVAGALAGAGIVLMLGMGVAYIAIAVFYALAALLTSLADSAQRRGAWEEQAVAQGVPRRVTGWTDLCDGIAYIRSKPSLIAIIWLALLFNFTAFPLTNGLLPYVAREVYGVDQSGLGYLVASIACGAMVGGLLAGSGGAGVRLARLMVVSGVVWHLLLLVFAQMEVWHLGMAVLFVTGMAQSLTMISLTVVLVREAGDRFRGRVMGVRMMAIYSLPVGLLFAGWLIDEIGYSGTATLYATFGLVSIIFIAVRWRADMWASAR